MKFIRLRKSENFTKLRIAIVQAVCFRKIPPEQMIIYGICHLLF